jgi:hypothetical protein
VGSIPRVLTSVGPSRDKGRWWVGSSRQPTEKQGMENGQAKCRSGQGAQGEMRRTEGVKRRKPVPRLAFPWRWVLVPDIRSPGS